MRLVGMTKWVSGVALLAAAGGLFAGGCSASSGGGSGVNNGGNGGSGNNGGSGAEGGFGAFGGSGGQIDGGGGSGGDPSTCEGAAAARSYFGCDFYPTVVSNAVWSIFDYAVVVANTNDSPVNVEVTFPGSGTLATETVPAFGVSKIFLPWVPALKGGDADECGSSPFLNSSIRGQGAFHLTTDKPVSVYQFNALEYRGAGGPAGKSWNNCPGDRICAQYLQAVGCFSFSNDASLLVPSTAWTGNYRIMGPKGQSTYFAVTGKTDGTQVEVLLSSTASVAAGAGIPATGPGGTFTFTVNANEVVEVVTSGDADLSGTLVRTTDGNSIQVITGSPCITTPTGAPACDHIEETVFPAETLGAHYFVTVPTGPNGNVVGHVVRIFGNQDGTTLSYPGGQPNGAPTTINAGQVVDIGQVSQDFEITGDKEFAVGSFMLGGSLLDPNGAVGEQKGDPSMSFATAVEQYRKQYVFLAPDDYDISYVDIVMPTGASVTLDGAAISVTPTPIASGFGIARVRLGNTPGGGHILQSTEPVGIQVMGYGAYTSYQYPGGLNLEKIAPPPPK